MDKLKRDERWRKEGGDLAYFKVNKIHKKKMEMKLKLSRHAQTATFGVCRRAEILKLDQYREGGNFSRRGKNIFCKEI